MVDTVKVQALQHHSYSGKNYGPGDTYDIEASLADSVQVQGKAARVDLAAHAKAIAKPAKPAKAVKSVKKAKARAGKK